MDLAKGIVERLKEGVEVLRKAPYYMNGIVGEGYVGYTISLENAYGRQIDAILKVRNDKALFEAPTITMTVHMLYHFTASGKKERIESTLVNHAVILMPKTESQKVINDYYAITGIIKLKEEPP